MWTLFVAILLVVLIVVAIRYKSSPRLKAASRWFRYAYFLRFSILLWILPLGLALANSPKIARAFVSGIMTPVLNVQYLCASFFLIAGSLVSLILARIVVINGQERFGDDPPAALVWLLAHPEGKYEWIALVLSLLNSVTVFVYFLWNGHSEGVDGAQMAWGILWGAILSFLFWYAVSAFYYLTYRPQAAAAHRAFGAGAARTLIFPRAWMFLSDLHENGSFGDALEDAETPVSFNWIQCCFPIPGYRQPGGDLYEGHYLGLVAGAAFVALYWLLWPLTAPVPERSWATFALIAYFAGAVGVYAVVVSAKNAANAAKLRIWKALLAVPILGFAIAIPVLYECYDAARFPILALVLILAIASVWTLGAVAFFADRYRIPVITAILLSIFVPRFLHWDMGREEHYLSVTSQGPHTSLPTPAAIVNDRITRLLRQKTGDAISQNELPYLIVVTSTGGGIHAAAWTAEVLRQLEEKFGQSPAEDFHHHVVLLSTVSGGSAGLYPYLREIAAAHAKEKIDWKRMTIGAKCSSLEAIGWGLVYFDMPKLIVPFGPYLWGLSSGVDDLEKPSFGKDRTWALRKAMARNLNDPFCEQAPKAKNILGIGEVTQAQQNTSRDEQMLTVGQFNPVAGDDPPPAFTMNSTTAEDGARFLSANYMVPPQQPPVPYDPVPAESFLQVYGNVSFPEFGAGRTVDLPLATAAQLSATFPYVSSAARFPFVANKTSQHFVDGGYYDNDGTASVIEFLRAALDGRAPELPKVRILLVEIRNSPDPDPPSTQPKASRAWQNWKSSDQPWNSGNQVTAPLSAFYGAGHESTTARNRNGLLLLGDANLNKLELKHIVIDDQCAAYDVHTDPLNWSLTPKQQKEVEHTANLGFYKAKYEAVLSCFTGTSCDTNLPPIIPDSKEACSFDAHAK